MEQSNSSSPKAPLTHKVIAFALVGLLGLEVFRVIQPGRLAAERQKAVQRVQSQQDRREVLESQHAALGTRIPVPVVPNTATMGRSERTTDLPPGIRTSGASSVTHPALPGSVAVYPLPSPPSSGMSLPPAIAPAPGIIRIAAGVPVRGVVRLEGEPPTRVIPFEVKCGDEVLNDLLPPPYRLGDDRGLGDVVVHVDKGASLDGAAPEVPEAPVEIELSHCLLSPYVVVARVGQRIRIRNLDSDSHFLQIAVSAGLEEAVRVLPGGSQWEFPMRGSQPFQHLVSPVASWTSAYLTGFRHSWFAVSGTNGDFTLPPLLAGRHEIVAQHRKLGGIRTVVEVADSAPASVLELRLTVSEALTSQASKPATRGPISSDSSPPGPDPRPSTAR